MEIKLNQLPQIPKLKPNIKEVISIGMLRNWTISIASVFESTDKDVELYYKLIKAAFNKIKPFNTFCVI